MRFDAARLTSFEIGASSSLSLLMTQCVWTAALAAAGTAEVGGNGGADIALAVFFMETVTGAWAGKHFYIVAILDATNAYTPLQNLCRSL